MSDLPVVITSATNEKVYINLWRGSVLEKYDIGSDQWNKFMADGKSFSVNYFTSLSDRRIKFTVVPEWRKKRLYWRAVKTISGKSERKYIGANITRDKLNETGQYFYNLVKEAREKARGREALLEDAVEDLEALVRELLALSRSTKKAEKAREDLESIMDRLDNE